MTEVTRLQWFPADCFHDKDAACEIKDCTPLSAAVANNQQVIAAVSGKRIRVISGTLYSTGATTDLVFKSANAGVSLHSYRLPASPSDKELEERWSGHFETLTGQGLFVDNTAVTAGISLRYIEYTP